MSKKRAIGVIVAAALVGLAAFVLWDRSGSHEQGDTRRAGPSETRATAPVRARDPRAAPAPAAEVASDEPVRLTPATIAQDPTLEHGELAGRVVNWGTGMGVAGADVVFAHGDAATTVRTDASGAFRFAPSASATYRLAVVTADGYMSYAPQWGRSPIEVTARPGLRVEGLVVYLTPEIEYRGTVIDSDDQPVAGATVSVIDDGLGQRELAPDTTTFRSDTDGRFTFSAPDMALLEASHDEHGKGRARVDGAVQVSHEMTIRVARDAPAGRDASIAGIVVDESGAPVGDVEVVAAATPRSPGSATVSGPDGAFTLDRLDAGRYSVRASSPGKVAARIAAETGATDVRLVLRDGAVVRGRVTSSDGPVASFSVAVLEKETALFSRLVANASVFDGEGRFEVGGLEEGDYEVRVAAHGYAQSAPVPAKASAHPPQTDVTLSRGGTVFGQVIDGESRQPLARAKVTLESRIGSGTSALPFSAVAITDDKGNFELSGLPPGPQTVQAAAYQHHTRLVSQLDVADGQRKGPIAIELTPTKDGEQPRLELAGIGAVLSAEEQGLRIQRVIDGGGAAAAGLGSGDVIIGVEGTSVVELGFEGTLQRIRGPVGTTVRLTVQSDAGVREVTAQRRKIRT